jgi:hypothetical protein
MPCTANSFSTPGSSACTCSPGFFDTGDGTCTACVAGTYKENGDNVCVPCAVDTYSYTIAATSQEVCQTCPAHSVSLSSSNELVDCMCEPRWYGSLGGPCSLCQAGRWCSGGSRYRCPISSSSVGGSTELTDCTCEAGFVGPNGGPCQSCTADGYCPGGVESFMCATTSSSPPGSSTSLDCICDGGYQGDAGGPCTLCPANTYCKSGILSACHSHALSSSGSDELVDCICKQGYYGNNGEACVICPAKSFCIGGNSILSCPPHSQTLGGSNTSLDCICMAGWYGSPGGVCTECEYGWWCHAGVKTRCPINSYTENGVGASKLTDCVCEPGFKGLVGSACSVCTTNTWCQKGVVNTCTANSNAPAQSSVATACICHTGHTRSSDGMCLACAAGTYKNKTGDAPCTACGVDKYSVWLGAVSADTCSDCPTNTLAAYASNELADCICLSGYIGNNGTACTSCPVGTYKENHGTGVCVPCKVDTYSNVTAANSSDTCLSCPGNTFAVAASIDLANCICKTGYIGNNGTACTACAAGTHKNTTGPGVCTYCDGGTYSTTTAANSSKTCLFCPWNTSYSGVGSNDFTDCVLPSVYIRPEYTTTKATVDFEATLYLNISEFGTQKRTTYMNGVAFALRVAKNAVAITSVAEQSMRRRLLSTYTTGNIALVVSTSITVAAVDVEKVVVATTSENLNRVLVHSDILVGRVSLGQVLTESTQWILIMSVVAGSMLVLTWGVAVWLSCWSWYRKRYKKPGVGDTTAGDTRQIMGITTHSFMQHLHDSYRPVSGYAD